MVVDPTDDCFWFANEFAWSSAVGNSEWATYIASVCTVALPPTNDECENAICLEDGVPAEGSTVKATTSGLGGCVVEDANDVWYSYRPQVSGLVTISLCGSSFDTTLSVYEGCGGTLVACNDNACGSQSEVTTFLTAGVEYLIRIVGVFGASGDYTISVTGGGGICDFSCVLPVVPNLGDPNNQVGVSVFTTLRWNQAAPNNGPNSQESPTIVGPSADVWPVVNQPLGVYHVESSGNETVTEDFSVPNASSGCLIVNGDFETGDFTGWIKVDSGSGTFVINDGTYNPLSSDGPIAPCGGAFSALTDQSEPGTHTLYQDVTIPSGATTATLNWTDIIRNHHTDFVDPGQEFRVEIRDSTTNAVLQTLYSTNPGDPLLNSCTSRSADISAYIGQTIRVAFTEEDNEFFFNLHLDDICIEVVCPTTYDVYLDTDNPPMTKVCSDIEDPNTECDLSTPLLSCTTYYWRVVAKSCCGVAAGPVWSFTTGLLGDITGEGNVNMLDFVEVAGQFGSVGCSDPDWCNGADGNRDGMVDLWDVILLDNNWLQECPVP